MLQLLKFLSRPHHIVHNRQERIMESLLKPTNAVTHRIPQQRHLLGRPDILLQYVQQAHQPVGGDGLHGAQRLQLGRFSAQLL